MKKKRWCLDETSKHFITVILEDNKQDIIKFRKRWKLEDSGLEDRTFYKNWREKIEKECQNLRREIKVIEIEAYIHTADALLPNPILSSETEGHPREENWGDSLESIFALEIRALGLRLNFPPEWDRFLEYFITYNQKNFDLIFNQGLTMSIRSRINEEFGLISENVSLTLGINTVSEDLNNLWNKQVKPLLINLDARLRDKKRKSKNASVFEELIKRGARGKGWQEVMKDPATNKNIKELDRDIVIATMDDKKLDKLYHRASPGKVKKINEKLGKKIQNIRYYRSKRRPSN